MRLRINSGGNVALEWAPGVGVAIGAGWLAFWRGTIVTAERVKALKDELARVESEQKTFQAEIHAAFNETLEKLHSIVTELKVVAAEQGAFNRVCTKTLEGIANRLEFHDSVLKQAEVDIAILKTKGQQGQ